ncbi:ArsR family transcriptional regulator [Halobacteriales archaeon QS_6_71_20]|nr:MAG: ArsR family transcriptional regulator [Halobacteriales archaeon QS_6_71_20]
MEHPDLSDLTPDGGDRDGDLGSGADRANPAATAGEAADALSALASEHRIAILRELAAADWPLSFSELRERIGMRDGGRFNYHLGELRDRFVRERDGGYVLGHAGERVVLAAGDLDPAGAAALADGSGDSGPDDACPVCGETDCERVIHVHLDGR